MALTFSIDRTTSVITIDRLSMPEVPNTASEVRTFDVVEFHHLLRDNEDDWEGIHFPTTHNWKDPITIGGVTLAAVFELLDPYTVTFEDGLYTVYVVGANSNLGDKINKNQVSVYIQNSAGLVDPINFLNALEVINNGVKKSSILVPHTEDLP